MAFWHPLVCIVVFLAICTESSTGKCTHWEIDECVSENTNTNGCVFHSKINQCINQFLDECSGSARIMADREINLSKAQRAACPGLPDGQCYFGALSECMALLKTPDSFYDDSKKSTTKDCINFKQSATNAKNCLRKVKASCLIADVSPSMKMIDEDVKKICG